MSLSPIVSLILVSGCVFRIFNISPPNDAPKIDAWERPEAGLEEKRKRIIPSGTYIPPPPTPQAVATPAAQNHTIAPSLYQKDGIVSVP